MATTIFQELASNAALLLLLSFLYIQIVRRLQKRKILGQVLNGILFGGVAIGVMLSPFDLLPGVVFDTRSVVISVGGLFGGPVVAAITFAMASVFRVWQGGAGAMMGVAVSFFSAALGAAYYFWKQDNPRASRAPYLYGFGVLVHLVMLGCTLALPGEMTWRVLADIALPVMVIYPLATLLLCLLIADRESRILSDRLLKESEERYRRMVDTANEGIWVIDSEHKTTFVNARIVGMLGHAQDEILGRPLSDFVFPEDLPTHQEQMKLRRQGQSAQYEQRMRKKDGGVLWTWVSATPIYEQGVFAGSLAMYTDITRRKQVEKEQKDEQLRQRMAMDLAKLVHWEYDAVADRFTFDDQFYALYGTTASDQGGNQMSSQEYARRFLPPEDASLVAGEVALALAAEDSDLIRQLEHRIIRADGQERFISVRFAIVKDEKGKTIKTHGVNQDITERKLAERELARNEELFRNTFEQAAVGMSILSPEGVWLRVNQRLCDILGYSRQELMKLNYRDITYPEHLEHDVSTVRQMVQGAGDFNCWEKRYVRKGGQVIWARLTTALARGEDGQPQYFVTVTEDITAHKQAEAEKTNLEAQLRQAQKMEAIGTLAGGIAHDFNNILAAVLGFAEMAYDDIQSGHVDPADIAQIMVSAQRAKDLVQQILTFSRKNEPLLQPLDLNQIVRRTQHILERTLPKMVGIETHLASELPIIQADPTQMEQVLLNLSSNAQDAMPEGGRLVMETQEVVLDHEYCQRHLEVQPGRYVRLVFSDTGLGMDRKTREHIFEPFYTTKEIGRGTGLGLSTIFGIVKNHGGHIHCYSELGKGAVFRLYFPVLRDDQAQRSSSPERVDEEALRGSETILLADDEESLRQLGERVLKSMGYSVLTASSGEEALELYRQQGDRLDLVVMDLGMPGMGGHKAMLAILGLDPQAKLLIASGYSAHAQVKDSLQAGAAGYVAKPYKRSDLLATVRRVLDRDQGAPPGPAF